MKHIINNSLKQIAFGGGVNLLGRLIGRIVYLLLHILLTQLLTVQSYGLYALGESVTRILRRITMLGMENSVVRFGAMFIGLEDYKKLKGTIIIAIFIPLTISIIVSSVVYNFSDFIAINIFKNEPFDIVIKHFSIALPFYLLVFLTAFCMRAFRRMENEVIVQDISHPLLMIIFVCILYRVGYEMQGVLNSFILASIFASILGIYLLVITFPELISKLKAEFEVKKIVFYSVTVMLMGYAQILLTQTDRIMLGFLTNSENIGIYNIAALLASQIAVFLQSFNGIFSPIISDLYSKNDLSQLEHLFKTVTRWTVTMTIPFFVIFITYSNRIMSVFGDEFIASASSLAFLVFGQFINVSVGAVGFILSMTGHHKLELFNSCFVSVLNIALNCLFIPLYGIFGAALATGLSIIIINIIRLVEIYYVHGFHCYDLKFYKPICAGFVALLLINIEKLYTNDNILLIIISCIIMMIAYSLILIILGIEKSDKDIMVEFIKNK